MPRGVEECCGPQELLGSAGKTSEGATRQGEGTGGLRLGGNMRCDDAGSAVGRGSEIARERQGDPGWGREGKGRHRDGSQWYKGKGGGRGRSRMKELQECECARRPLWG